MVTHVKDGVRIMATRKEKDTLTQQIGLWGEYLVAAELTRRGYPSSLLPQDSKAADVVITDTDRGIIGTVQVKTSAKRRDGKKDWTVEKPLVAQSHVYVFVEAKGDWPDVVAVYHVVHSEEAVVAGRGANPRKKFWFYPGDLQEYENKWDVLERLRPGETTV